MSAFAGGGAAAAPEVSSVLRAAGIPLKVEQVSYAYAATDRSAPEFTLGPTSFEVRQR
jgi:hypothetical protein